MATQALYRRWRPQTFEDVIGQDHVTQTLRNALATGRVAHAYLFTGPRGTGKTSVARILAKAVNCLAEPQQRPCNECHICRAMSEGSHLDLIEIDAASNTGVDDVRDLRDKIHFAPNEARQKVYVIDEVHMLSNAAFNALLKTLEEPPAHALFVLATTEPHKIPETIKSRCQRFDFRRVSLPAIIGKLARICEAEGVTAEPAALEAIARAATGSLRDSESLLDQLLAFSDGTITLEQVQQVLGHVSSETVALLVDDLIARRVADGLARINETMDAGADARQLMYQLLEYLRGLMLLQAGDPDLVNVTEETRRRMQEQATRLSPQRLIKIIRCFSETNFNLKIGAQPQLPLELAFVEMALEAESQRPAATPSSPAPVSPSAAAPAPPAQPSPQPASASPKAVAESPARKSAPKSAETPPPLKKPATPEAPAPSPAGVVDLDTVKSQWEELLIAIRPHNRIVEALLRDCQPVSVEGNVVTLGFFYPFHRQKVEEPKNKALVAAMLSRVLGTEVQLQCQMIDKDTASQEVQKRRPKDKYQRAAEDPVIQATVQKFGAQIAGVESVSGPGDENEAS